MERAPIYRTLGSAFLLPHRMNVEKALHEPQHSCSLLLLCLTYTLASSPQSVRASLTGVVESHPEAVGGVGPLGRIVIDGTKSGRKGVAAWTGTYKKREMEQGVCM